MKLKNITLVVSVLLIGFTLSGQDEDLFLKLKKLSDADTGKSYVYCDIGNYYYKNSLFDSAYYFSMKGYELAKKQNYINGVYKNLNVAGLSLSSQGKNNEALLLFDTGRIFCVSAKYKKGEAEMLNGMGICETRKGNYKAALDHYLASLKIHEGLGADRKKIANLNNNIGVVYRKSNNNELARKYFRIALKIRMEIKDSASLALAYNNMSNTFHYNTKSSSDSVLYFLNKSLDIRLKINNEAGIAQCWNNIGIYYLYMLEPEKALEYFKKSYDLNKKLEIATEKMTSLINLSETYFDLKQFSEAKKYGEEALQVAKENEFQDQESTTYKILARIYYELKEYKRSAENFSKYESIRDTFFSQELEDKLTEARYTYEFEKKEIEVNAKAEADKEKTRAIAKKENEKQQLVILGVCIVLVLVIVFAFFMYKRYKLTQSQKIIIEEQKHLVDEKQKEMLDSIHYARRIQRALLANENHITKVLNRLMKK